MIVLRHWSLPILAGMLLLAMGLASERAHSAAPAAPPAASAAAPAEAPKPVDATVTDTLAQVLDSEARQRAALVRLQQAANWREIAERSPPLGSDLDRLGASIAGRTGLTALVEAENRLVVLSRNIDAAADELASIARRLERDSAGLDAEARNWQQRLAFMEEQQVPAAILDRARSAGAAMQRASMRLRSERDEVLLALNHLLTLQGRGADLRTRLELRQAGARAQRMELEEAPIWRLDRLDVSRKRIAEELAAGFRVLRDYVAHYWTQLVWLFIGVLLPTWWLLARRSRRGAAAAGPDCGPPAAAALLIALMALFGLARDAPLYFYEALFAVVPIPAALVAARTFARRVPLLLAGLTVAAVLFPLRNTIQASAVGDRLLLLLQVASFAVPLVVEMRRGRLGQAFAGLGPRLVRALAFVALAASALTVLQIVFGFVGPTRSLRAGVGSMMIFGLIYGAAAVAVYGLVLALLATPIFSWLRCAREPDPVLLRSVRVILFILAISGVALTTLGSFGLLLTTSAAVDSFMAATIELGTVAISIRALATALGVVVATILVATVTEFVLSREIVPRLRLSPGGGYALATFTRWTIVLVGVFLTFDALNVDMMKVTVLAGALGVGIGFGLQTIVNNFVSGLILIIERPVAVGDMLEIGPLLGEVKRIGIRSSTVRTNQGAEVIVPNSDLASKQVVNWTRSDRQRRYEIDVGVAYGSDPEQVMRLLVEAAKEVPEIMAAPPPMATFDGFGDSSLNFRLLAWVTTVDVGLKARTELRVAILRKLHEAGIEIPFPQRDLHIRSGADAASPARSSPPPEPSPR